jgi:hypothetical protein
MRKFLLALMMTVVVASLQAITIQWTVPSSGSVNTNDGWEDWTGKLSSESIYLVYSQTEWKTADEVWNANSGLKVALGNNGKATITDLSNKSDVTASQPSTWMNFSGENQINMITSISGESGFGPDGYYYLVVFDPTVGQDDDPKYAVSNAVHYTGGTDTQNGITQTTVKPESGKLPEVGDFVDIGWMGGTWTDATVPEPTALALLALGVAGLALRRKI